MALNTKSLNLIKEFEGCELTAYHCPAGVLTIGYGHTSAAGSPQVTPGMTITRDQAGAILRNDLTKYEAAVDAAVKVSLTANQRGALVSLCYNIGPGAFRKSTAVRRLNAGDYRGAAEAMTWFNKSGGRVLNGLVRRREAERELFLSAKQSATHSAGTIAPSTVVSGGEAKPLSRSKTVGLGGLTFAGALAMIKDVRETVPEVSEYLPYMLAALGLLVILNRWQEARKGEH